jgi:phage-related minor tail protein
MADDEFGNDGADGDFSGGLDRLSARTRGLESGANSFARAMTQAFKSAAADGKRFEDVLKSLALRLSDLSLQLALKPITKGIAGGLDGLFAGLFGGTTTPLTGGDRSLFTGLNDIPAFADGGVIATPSYFSMGQGRLGLAGEAGPEAILPLARGADGKLGVAAGGGSAPAHVTINIATPDAASFRRSEAHVTGLIARAVARGQRSL